MIRQYFEQMAKDGRYIIIKKNGKLHTFLTFSICDDYADYESKGLWEYMPHTPSGHICFVEKMASKGWSKHLRKEIEREIVKRFPQIEYAIWFRPTDNNDRRVIYRRKHEASL